MIHRVLVVAGVAAFSLSVVACASNPHQQTAHHKRPHQVCSYQSSIGSHIGNRECTSRSAYDAQHDANHKQAQKNSDMDSGGGGGR